MNADDLILGIESSCDETAAAVVAGGRRVLSSIVASQIELHSRFGGVVPELASRAHIEAVNTVVASALKDAGVGLSDLAAVAVTNEPGLIGSLLVGVMCAKTLAWSVGRALVPVNHVYAHAYAAALDAEPVEYPAAALICSGGHTALYHCQSPTELKLMGTTIDDAAGEAFDKVASILGLGYPGGPIIDKIARSGNPEAIRFPRTLLKGQSLDFSFSGIKTAVLYHVNGLPSGDAETDAHRISGAKNMSPQQIADVAASFQAAVVDVLRLKLRRAAKAVGAKTLLLGGGVAANSALRAAVEELAKSLDITLRLPPLRYCLDNAAMTAGLGWHYLRAGRCAGMDLEAVATVRR